MPITPDLSWLAELIPLEGPLWSWLLFGATAALVLQAVLMLLSSFRPGGLGRFLLAGLLGGVGFWTMSWMWGWHEPYAAGLRIAGWSGVALVLILATVHLVRRGGVVTGFIAAALPLVFVLGVADVTSRQSLEWRLVGVDREEIPAALGFGTEEERTGLAERRRRSWSDVAEAWRDYAEETRRLDEAIGRGGQDDEAGTEEREGVMPEPLQQ